MLRPFCLITLLTGALAAQSPLTTIYLGGNGLSGTSTIYFDVVLNAPLTFTQIDVNSSAAVGVSATIDVRWVPNTYVGNDTNPAVWTLGGTGPVTAAGANQPSPCTLTPFTLPPGNYGFAVTFNNLAQAYTDGNGTAVPGTGSNQTYSTAEMTLLAGASAGGAVGTAICCVPRVFNGSLHYLQGGGGTFAVRTNYGTGCYTRRASIYELFATSPAFDLANTAITMIPTGNGYAVLPGLTSYVAPSATAAIVTLTDDSEATVALSTPFPHSTGTTSSLAVCSNGYVSVASGNGTGYTPAAATTLAAPQTGWWCQHDYNPAIAAGGKVKFEEIGDIAYVTWDGVWDYSGATAANANTFQFQFDKQSGAVHIVFQTMSTLGNGRLIAYSPGGPSGDPGNQDLSAIVPAVVSLPAADQSPLALTASARPILGTTIQLTTANPTGLGVGAMFFGVAGIPAPGIDLAILGAPGCPALVDIGQAVGNLISNIGLPGTSMVVTLPIPSNTQLIGAAFYTQSVWLDPTANAFGILTSNGVELVLGDL